MIVNIYRALLAGAMLRILLTLCHLILANLRGGKWFPFYRRRNRGFNRLAAKLIEETAFEILY